MTTGQLRRAGGAAKGGTIVVGNTSTDSQCTDACSPTVWWECTTSGSNCGTC